MYTKGIVLLLMLIANIGFSATETWNCKSSKKDAQINDFKVTLTGAIETDGDFLPQSCEGYVGAMEEFPSGLEKHVKYKLSPYGEEGSLKKFSKVTVFQASSYFLDNFHSEEHEFVLMDTDKPAAELVTELDSGIGVTRQFFKCNIDRNF